MRELTLQEIAKFANRESAKKIAVENFLMSMGVSQDNALKNLILDAELYKWNYVTQRAIADGIKLASHNS